MLVLCHTRELAFQISKEYERFSKYMNSVKVAVFFGGMPIKLDEEVLKKNCPHIVVGTPGRILALARAKNLNLKNIKHFILDECDKMLEQLGKCCHRQVLLFWVPMQLDGGYVISVLYGTGNVRFPCSLVAIVTDQCG